MDKLKQIAYRNQLKPIASKELNNRENKRFPSLSQSIYDHRSTRRKYIERVSKSENDIESLEDTRDITGALKKQVEDLKRLNKKSIEVELSLLEIELANISQDETSTQIYGDLIKKESEEVKQDIEFIKSLIKNKENNVSALEEAENVEKELSKQGYTGLEEVYIEDRDQAFVLGSKIEKSKNKSSFNLRRNLERYTNRNKKNQMAQQGATQPGTSAGQNKNDIEQIKNMIEAMRINEEEKEELKGIIANSLKKINVEFQQAIQNRGNKLELSTIPLYAGIPHHYNEWITRLETVFNINEVENVRTRTEIALIRTAPRSQAFDYIQSILTEELNTWKDVKQKMETRFGVRGLDERNRVKLEALRQVRYLDNYVNEFRKISKKLNLTEESKLYHFMKGLKSEQMKFEIVHRMKSDTSNNKTEAAITIAEEFDSSERQSTVFNKKNHFKDNFRHEGNYRQENRGRTDTIYSNTESKSINNNNNYQRHNRNNNRQGNNTYNNRKGMFLMW